VFFPKQGGGGREAAVVNNLGVLGLRVNFPAAHASVRPSSSTL
jgi:hypothetical protein